ncbi:MAG: hypothetical protein MRJ96_09795 [Nitrospirales bacterium]|nr:hypothetical protein [Nitrospira sp.]MDR4501728.1 hypothetical protein [Nitrospirales bacterium]
MKIISSLTVQSRQARTVFQRLLYWTVMSMLMLGLSAQPVFAEEEKSDKAADIGLGIASFLSTLPYGAVKIAYAGLGAIVGGFTYLLTAGDLDSANIVWEKSLLGTYVITPEHLTGDKPVRFLGP